jgi:hypothetical protein
MADSAEDMVAQLFKRGFNPHGIIYVMRLLQAEHPVGSDRRKELELAEQGLLE